MARPGGCPLVSFTCISMGLAARVRTRAFAAAVDSRPQADPAGRKAQRRSWAAPVVAGTAAREEARRWWAPWLASLLRGRRWAENVMGLVRLGPAFSSPAIPAPFFKGCELIALRLRTALTVGPYLSLETLLAREVRRNAHFAAAS